MINTFKHLLTILFASVFSLQLFAAPPGVKDGGQNAAPLSFIENKGQVTDQYNEPRRDIQFSLKAAGGLNIFVGNGALHYQFNKNTSPQAQPSPDDIKRKHEEPAPATFIMYRLDVELVGANKNAAVITELQQDYYENYFTAATSPKGATALTFNKITYKDIYPNIDWVLYTRNGTLKHEFVIRHGGKAIDIKLKYGGAENLVINADGSLTAKTPLGDITEQAPQTYRNGEMVPSSFVLHGNILTYATGTYTDDIVIDPSLIWSTYFGGNAADFGIAMTMDKKHDLYITGWTGSVTGIATAGAYQNTFAGPPFDAYLAKFNSSGMPLWATYYGGSSYDAGFAVTTDTTGNVYMSGSTRSTTAISTTGTYQPDFGGYYDGFLAKFNSSGIPIWATYFGGTGWDECLALKTDKAGNLFMAGATQSANAISTPGAYQAVLGGDWDAFLAKFDSSGVMQWSTYLGGAAEDVAYAMAIDTAGDLYMAGYTGSATAIATPGAFQTTYGGGYYDAFLAKITSAGSVVWSTYYGGADNDQLFSVTIDTSEIIYVTGMTASTSAIATPGAYQTTFAGGSSDAFLSRFNNLGAPQWTTYFGGPDLDVMYGVATDSIGDVYVTGATGSTSGIATLGAFQPVSGGYFDAFLGHFTSLGVLKWASYFGGNKNDMATSIVMSDSSRVYISGYTSSPSGVATPGAYQTAYGGDSYDAFLAKFNFCETPAVAPVAGPTTLCPGDTIILTDSTLGGAWSSADVAIATVGTTGKVTGVASGIVIMSYNISTVCGDSTAVYPVTVLSDTFCTQGIHAITRFYKDELKISPNPNQGTFTINLTSDMDEEVTIVVTNVAGIKVADLATTTNKESTLQLHEAPGIYLLSASTARGRHVAKLIINR